MVVSVSGALRIIKPLHLNSYAVGLGLFVLAYIISFSFITLMRYYTFRTYVDLGIFNQAFSSALHGRLFYETPDLLVIPSGSLLGTHFSLLMFLLLPIYLVHPGPETLLVVQTIFVGLGAVPIYLTSLHLLKSYRLSLGLASVYLLTPAVHSLNMFDFHLEAFLPFFLGMFFYSLLREKWWAYCLFLGLSLITIEFGPVMVFAICTSYLLSNRARLKALVLRPKRLLARDNVGYSLPLLTILLAVAVFYLSLMAAGYVSGTNTSPQRALAGFFPTLTQWLGANDGLKLTYWVMLLGAVMFVPVLAPARLFMAFPWMVVTILTTIPAFTELGYQHAGAFVAPFLILASIYAIRKVNLRLPTRVLLSSMILVCILTTPLNPLVQPWIRGIVYEDGLPIPTSHDLTLHRVIDLVPPNGSILTQENLFSYFSSRPDAYVYLPSNATVTNFILGDNTSSWYTIAIVPPLRWQTYTFSGIKPVSGVVTDALSSGRYGIVANTEGIILLEENYKGPPLLSG